MATEVENKEQKSEKTVTESTWKRLMKVAEFRMLLYVIPAALIVFTIAMLLGK
jgi:hypothetical protein